MLWLPRKGTTEPKYFKNVILLSSKDLWQMLNSLVHSKYHNLAKEAATLARREHEKTKQEKVRVQKLAETACKSFELDIKEKMKVGTTCLEKCMVWYF